MEDKVNTVNRVFALGVLFMGIACNARPVMEFLTPSDVKIEDAFWSPKFEVWRTRTIGDVFDKFEGRHRHDDGKSDWFANFDRVAAGRQGDGSHVGPHFANGLVYEAIRGASDYLLQKPDPALEARLDGYVARIAAGTVANGSLTGTIQPGGTGAVATLTLDNATLAGTLKIDATDTGPFDARGLVVELEEGTASFRATTTRSPPSRRTRSRVRSRARRCRTAGSCVSTRRPAR